MLPRAPSLFEIEEGAAAAASTTMPVSSAQLVGLRLIIHPSAAARQQRVSSPVLRRSAVMTRGTPAATTHAPSSTNKCHENGPTFVGLEFLKSCFCCHKKLHADMDVFVYKGEHAFCSAECRSRHIAKEERREMEILVRKRRDAFHSRHAAPPKTEGSNRRLLRLQIAA